MDHRTLVASLVEDMRGLEADTITTINSAVDLGGSIKGEAFPEDFNSSFNLRTATACQVIVLASVIT